MTKQIPLAHVRIQGIDCAVFGADAPDRSNHSRNELLGHLTSRARAAGLVVSKRALAFRHAGRVTFFGDDDLVRFLSRKGTSLRWTHKIDL